MKTVPTLLLSVAINAVCVWGLLSYRDWSAHSAKQAALKETQRLETEAKREVIEHQISQVYEAWRRGEFVHNRQVLEDIKGANGWSRRNEIEIETLSAVCGELRNRVKELENKAQPPMIGSITNNGPYLTNFIVPETIIWTNILNQAQTFAIP